MEAQSAKPTLTEPDMMKVQLNTPKLIWTEFRIQAIREAITAERLATKAFELYLSSIKAQ